MKPIQLPDDIIAAKLTSLRTVARRLCKIRGTDDEEDGDGCEMTNADPEMSQGGKVAVIPIRGIMAPDCYGWFPWATDTGELEELLDEAENDANVAAIVLDINSPGGAVNGSMELAEFVAGMTKPVVAFTSGDCCSAAYWVAASADAILIRSSASVGSVGVYSAVLDLSTAYEQAGYKVELFTSGEQKGAGYPGTSLTDPQREVVRADVMRLAGIFQNHVTTYRPEINVTLLDGRTVSGEQAVEEGFADEVVSGINDAIAAAQALGSVGT